VCNDFGNNVPYSDYLAAFSQIRIPVKWPNAAPNGGEQAGSPTAIPRTRLSGLQGGG
jgi:hypothetical protein